MTGFQGFAKWMYRLAMVAIAFMWFAVAYCIGSGYPPPLWQLAIHTLVTLTSIGSSEAMRMAADGESAMEALLKSMQES